ncbi:hypothetical protein BSL78_17663 [Apostichopus japonicus]|uniref:Uncharacterized protein n=1 Tax=Stichopus japonicus TaxID=307972 RepID=A0A2G8KBY1_STIJA|nr:hypothetical protein BSL78_17663 [Apostichopus japonicus]
MEEVKLSKEARRMKKKLAKKNSLTNGGVELPEVNGFHKETDALENGQVIKRKLDDAETPIKRKKKRKSKEVAVIKETNGQELEPQITELLKEEKLAEMGRLMQMIGGLWYRQSPKKKKIKEQESKVWRGQDHGWSQRN